MRWLPGNCSSYYYHLTYEDMAKSFFWFCLCVWRLFVIIEPVYLAEDTSSPRTSLTNSEQIWDLYHNLIIIGMQIWSALISTQIYICKPPNLWVSMSGTGSQIWQSSPRLFSLLSAHCQAHFSHALISSEITPQLSPNWPRISFSRFSYD